MGANARRRYGPRERSAVMQDRAEWEEEFDKDWKRDKRMMRLWFGFVALVSVIAMAFVWWVVAALVIWVTSK